jgi:hypothetical protein
MDIDSSLRIPPLDVPRNALPKTRIGKWLFNPDAHGDSHEHPHAQPWHKVLWLTGVDYFSTLGYQPGIALLAAGALSPIATLILVAVTLLCALPAYAQVSRKSFAGQGSIAMLESLLNGWYAKIFVLVLLGFAATDFIITITLSAADAALHLAENPLLHAHLGNSQLLLTIGLMALLAIVFLRGFSEAIGLAALIAIPYIFLNFLILAAGITKICLHPEVIDQWKINLNHGGDWTHMILISVLVFPKLALGMSGFETGVSVMPLVVGEPEDKNKAVPEGRIYNTRKLLSSAAIIMSILLIMSSFVTTMLIPESAYQPGGEANGRAISYLSHHLLGAAFGTVYDVSTILVLWFAGASAMAGMLNLIPRYLPRFGMAPQWIAHRRPLVLILFFIAVFVTWAFNANVDAQGSAYATGVLALMLSAAIAVALSLWNEKKIKSRVKSVYFWIVAGVFFYTFFDNVIVKPDGLLIAAAFVIGILISGAISRWNRALELRVSEISLVDEKSAEIWQKILNKKVHLVPLSRVDVVSRVRKARELRAHYRFEGAIAFLNVKLADNRSDFLSNLQIQVTEDEVGNVLLEVSGANAIANTIAYISELLNPISIFVGLTRTNLMGQAFRYILWGEGETGMLVYRILLRYWEWTPEDDVRPFIFLMSE